MKLTASAETIAKWSRYKAAQAAKSQWTAVEKASKEALLLALGYEPDDPKPAPATFVDESGEELFEVKVAERRVVDTKYLRRSHPDVYAESEKLSHPISIREVE